MSPLMTSLLKMPWADLARHRVTKKELRAAGWSEGKVKRYLGKPDGRHSSEHFLNPLGQPYWTGQQVLKAAVVGGMIPTDVAQWPYLTPVNGLTRDGWFVMSVMIDGSAEMHPEVDPALRQLVLAQAGLITRAKTHARLAELAELADPNLKFSALLERHFDVRFEHFPPGMPERECLDGVLWAKGELVDLRRRISTFTDEHMLLAELQSLPDCVAVAGALADDIESGEGRFERLGTFQLADLCGIDPEDGDGDRVHYAYWQDFDDAEEPWVYLAQLGPYVSPARFKVISRWADRLEEGEVDYDPKRLTAREREVLDLLYNIDGMEDRVCSAVCTHSVKDAKGREVSFQFIVGDGGSVEDGSGPYDFDKPRGIPADDGDSLRHPKTGRTLRELRWKRRKKA